VKTPMYPDFVDTLYFKHVIIRFCFVLNTSSQGWPTGNQLDNC